VSVSAPRRGDIVRIRDERWTVAETRSYTDATLLTVVGCDRLNSGCRTRYLLPFESWERLPCVETTRVVSHRQWQRLAREVLGQATPSAYSLVAAASADISVLPYQLEPALAVASGAAARVLIADDVGLGKTIQAGLIIAETLARRTDANVLVLCPAGLRNQWQDELTRRFCLAPVALDSAALRRLPLIRSANPWGVHPLIVTSTDYIKRPEVIRALESLVWDLLVIDEAHAIAGPSDRHHAANLLAQRARSVVMLTATPHSGSNVVFERLRSVGDFERSFPLMVFRRTRAEASGQVGRRTRWLRVRSTVLERRMHRALMSYVGRVWRHPASPGGRLAMIVLTRRACSSPSSLARTLERRLALLGNDVEPHTQLALPLDVNKNADAEPAQVGSPGLDDAPRERRQIEHILALARQAAGEESKLRALSRLLRRIREPAIVFTEYRDTLAVLERRLARLGTCQLHGGLTSFERAAAIRAFTSGERRLLLATDAASEGLNLHQRCRLVIHLEVPWTPTRIEQRVGRVDRIGQSRTVHQIHLVAAGTVEQSRVVGVVRRMAEVAVALRGVSTPVIEQEHADASIVGNRAVPSGHGLAALPRGVVAGDLRAAAATEAERLLAVRRIRAESTLSVRSNGAPFATSARRPMARSALWVLSLELVDAEGRLLWETLVGIHGTHRSSRPPTLTRFRGWIDAGWAQLRSEATRRYGPAIATLTDSVRTPATRTATRERAIAHGIADRRGRIAAHLIQQGLFDHRTERDALAQRELVEVALSRCQARIAELQLRSSATDIKVRPAFALIAW
jgi:superfamily II DNA or RNA helicase